MIEVFAADTPPKWTQHNDWTQAVFIKGNMGGLVLIKLRAGSAEMHSHEQEHVGVVLEGAFAFTTEDGDVNLQAGQVYRIPPNIAHGVRCDDHALIAQARA